MMDNQYSYLADIGESRANEEDIQNKVNTQRQKFESDKSADVSAHILLNGVMHSKIEQGVKYLTNTAERKITNGLRSLKNKALQKYKGLQEELKNASDEDKPGLQTKINEALEKLKNANKSLKQKLGSKSPNETEQPKTYETIKKEITPEETEFQPERTIETKPAFEREVTPEQKVITQEAKPEISEEFDKPSLARDQPAEFKNINNLKVKDLNNDDQPLKDIENRISTRYNNLDGKAQLRSDEAFNNAKKGPSNIEDQTMAERKFNVKLRNKTVKDEEVNPETSFKNPDLKIEPNQNISPEDDILGRVGRVRNQDSFDNPAEKETRITQEAQDEISEIRPPVMETVPAEFKTIPEQTIIKKPATYENVTQEVKADTSDAAGADTGAVEKSVGKGIGKMFEEDAIEGADEGPLGIIAALIVGAITTLPSILKKEKEGPQPAQLNASAGLNLGEVP
tara:strand:+ start:3187 stop:4551 length:1365 start_codon:yes stop_codon:yes gene_type:complete